MINLVSVLLFLLLVAVSVFTVCLVVLVWFYLLVTALIAGGS